MKNKKYIIEKEKLNEDNFLLYVPIKKHEEWELKSGNVVLIFHHDKFSEKFMRWLSKKTTVSDIKLDDIGSQVWQGIDGVNTVYEIGKKLLDNNKIREEYKNLPNDACDNTCHPIYNRLIMYLRYLNRKGWISFRK